ncbi:hypothetical protein F3Y22_tig00110461pilonHSYRG00160 [Hibiscus syriacus]|uniref:CCHC-type domain-containing protein n=1 Tax=Hibiscus syriacus TaxID=106335 RepID=A0A6A3AJ38_HIBSY|nr:hypothetical protein F3Y22_tig00110461pilonHSYRG00160 [Hibiscus syriacus]
MATKFDIEKFNGRNFLLWKLKMNVILRKDGYLAAISERPVDFTDDNKWIEMDGNAMSNFHLALAYEVLSSIEEKKITKEIWDHLTKLYEATSLHSKIFLKRKLYTLRMSESTSLTEHLNTLNTLFSQLTSLSCKIVEQERAELLLQSLPDSYDQLIINLTNSNVTNLVFDDVADAVLQEENRYKNKEDIQVNLQQVEALITMRGRSTERGQSSSHKHGRSKSRSKKNLKCYNCRKKGYLKKDCWSLNKNSNPQGNTVNTSDDGDALSCEASNTVEGRKRYADIWLIDSGATYHMISRREWFNHYEPVSGGSVYSCNDHALEIIGVGTIKLKISDSAMLWQQKLRHMSEQRMKVLVEKKLLPGLTKVSLPLCEHCITSKQHRLKFNTSNSRAKSVLEFDHSDVWQAPVTSLGGAKYFVSFIDDYSRRCWVYAIKKKSYEKRHQKIVHSGEYSSTKWSGRADEQNLVRKKRAMLRDADLEKSFWPEAVNTACYLVNRAPSTTIGEDTNGDMDWKCKFLGYDDGVKGYLLWDPTARKVIINRDVIFVEDKLQRKEDDDSTEKSETTQINVEKEFEQGDSSEAEPTHDEPESFEAPTTCQSDQDDEPSTYQEAINNSMLHYDVSMHEEIEALHKNNTWDLVPLPQGRKPIGNKWIFKIKRNSDDQVERYRARLVVKGYAQKEEQLDVKTTFLHGNLEEDIYMLQPEGFEEKKRTWTQQRSYEELKEQLAREFEMKDLGSANKILGIMQDCKPISTPLSINFKLSSSMSPSSEEERMEMSRVPYASAVGKLMFAMICTRPDIAQAVRAVSRYMAYPGKEHWNTIKRILRYIKGTSNIALCYRGSNLSSYPEDDERVKLEYQQFLVGSEILVVPVLDKGKNVKAYFSVGEICFWQHIWTGKQYHKQGSEAFVEAPIGYLLFLSSLTMRPDLDRRVLLEAKQALGTNARHVRSAHSRLSFLGQYVLELALAEFFLQRYPRESPGPMRERVFGLIGKRNLPKWIKAASLQNLISF